MHALDRLRKLHLIANQDDVSCRTGHCNKIAEGELPTRFELPAATLRQIIEKTRFAISTEETRYYLMGIFLHLVDDQLRAAATDGHRLARVTVAKPDGADGNEAVGARAAGEPGGKQKPTRGEDEADWQQPHPAMPHRLHDGRRVVFAGEVLEPCDAKDRILQCILRYREKADSADDEPQDQRAAKSVQRSVCGSVRGSETYINAGPR